MAFFNSKEEVFDVELTQYGKLLLSRGLLKPAYYTFHDEDVLYDSEYAGVSENTNTSEVRIQDETPVHKPFYSFSSLKPNIDRDFDQENFLANKASLALDKPYLSSIGLSNSTISNLYLPSWEIYNLSSEFVSSSLTYTNKHVISASIPQFDVEIDTKFIKTNQQQIQDNSYLQTLFALEKVTYDGEENVFITVNKPLVIKVIENNCDFTNDAFEIEIFKVGEDNDGNETYTQLKFQSETDNYDEDSDMYVQVSNLLQAGNIDISYANFYFDTLVDKELETINVCRYILKTSDDQDSMFNDASICDDLRTKFDTNDLYEFEDLATGKNC